MMEKTALNIKDRVALAIRWCYEGKTQDSFGLLSALQGAAALAGNDKGLAYILWAIGHCWHHVALPHYYSGKLPGQLLMFLQAQVMMLSALSTAGRPGKFAIASMHYLKGEILMLEGKPKEAVVQFDEALANYDLDNQYIKIDWTRETLLAALLADQDRQTNFKKLKNTFAMAKENSKFFKGPDFSLLTITFSLSFLQVFDFADASKSECEKIYKNTSTDIEEYLKTDLIFTSRKKHLIALGKKMGLDAATDSAAGGK